MQCETNERKCQSDHIEQMYNARLATISAYDKANTKRSVNESVERWSCNSRKSVEIYVQTKT